MSLEWSAPARGLCRRPRLTLPAGAGRCRGAPWGCVSAGGSECRLHRCPHEHTWGYPLTGLSRHWGLQLLGAMHWAWAAAAVALGLQLLLLRGVGARREPKRPQQPSQRTEPPTATTSHSEGLLGSPKVRSGRLHVGRVAHTGLGRPPGSWRATFSVALPCLGGVELWATTGAPGPGEGWGRGGAVLDPLKPQVLHASSSLLWSRGRGQPPCWESE